MLGGETHGKVFVRKLRPAKLMEFEDDFCSILEEVQSTADLNLERHMCARVVGLSRSLRRVA